MAGSFVTYEHEARIVCSVNPRFLTWRLTSELSTEKSPLKSRIVLIFMRSLPVTIVAPVESASWRSRMWPSKVGGSV